MTADSIIKLAMRQITVLVRGRALSADEVADCLEGLNNIVNRWKVHPFMTIANTVESFTLTSAKESYTIGTGGDFNTGRPDEIVYAGIRSGGVDYKLNPMTEGEYELLSWKSSTFRPTRYFYDPQYPLAVIYFNAKPDLPYELRMRSRKVAPTFPDTVTDIDYPANYMELFADELSIVMAAQFGKSASREIYERRDDSLLRTKIAQEKPEPLTTSGLPGQNGYGGGGNIYNPTP